MSICINKQSDVQSATAHMKSDVSDPQPADGKMAGNKSYTRGLRDYLTMADVSSSHRKNLGTEVLDNCLSSLNTLLTACYIHGLDKPSQRGSKDYEQKIFRSSLKTLNRVLLFIERTGCLSGWIDYWKYKLPAFFAYHEKEPLPLKLEDISDDDDPGYIFGGIIGQWIRTLLHSGDKTFLHTILMAKKGMPRASPELVKEAEKKNFITMTTPLEQFESIILQHSKLCCSEIPFTVQLAKSELRRTVRELFSDKKFSIDMLSVPTFPSTSSNYNYVRGDGGTVGYLKEHTSLFTDLDFKLEFDVSIGTFFDRQTDYLGSLGISDQDGICPDESKDMFLTKIISDSFKGDYKTFYWRCFTAAILEVPIVVPVGLAEPLKIRVITKGPALTYFVLKPFQKFLWRSLKDHPAFALIGEQVDVSHIENRLGYKLGSFYMSGDMKNATDDLHTWVSETIMDEISLTLDLPQPLRELCFRALTGHTYLYDGIEKKQARGQLMGSIISFPILCIATATTVRIALEVNREKKLLRHHPMLVNGDDNVSKTTDPLCYFNWANILRVFGPTASVGKSYFNQRFAVINSRIFDFSEGVWRNRPYVNLGLLKGYSRSQTDGTLLKNLAMKYNELLNSCPLEIRDNCKKMFMYYNSNNLKTYKGPWFWPERAGGLGMINNDFTYFERLEISASVRQKYESWPIDKKWNVRSLGLDYIKENTIYHEHSYKQVFGVDRIVDLEQEQEAVHAILGLKAMFTKPMDELLKKNNENLKKREARIMRDNLKLISRARLSIKDGGRVRHKVLEQSDIYVEGVFLGSNLILK
jgi:hypothetical protein